MQLSRPIIAVIRRCRWVLLGTACAVVGQAEAQARALVPEQPSVEVNLDSLRAITPIPMPTIAPIRPAPYLPPPPPPKFSAPVVVPLGARRVPEQQYEGVAPEQQRIIPPQNPAPAPVVVAPLFAPAPAPSVVSVPTPPAPKYIKKQYAKPVPKPVAKVVEAPKPVAPVVELPEVRPAPEIKPAPATQPVSAPPTPPAPVPDVKPMPVISAPPVAAPIPTAIPPLAAPVGSTIAAPKPPAADMKLPTELEPLPVIPPQPVSPLPESVEKRLKNAPIANVNEGTVSDKTVVKTAAPVPPLRPIETLVNDESAEAKRLAEADKKSAELSAAKRKADADAATAQKKADEATALAARKKAAEEAKAAEAKKMADEAAARIAEKKAAEEAILAKKKADAEALAAAVKKKAEDDAAALAAKKKAAEEAKAAEAQKIANEAADRLAEKKAAADAFAAAEKKKVEDAAASLAQMKADAEAAVAAKAAAVKPLVTEEKLPPSDLPMPMIPPVPEDKNILPKPTTPIVLPKSQIGTLPKLGDVPDAKSTAPSLPKLPDLAPAKVPSHLPSLTAITGDKTPSSMDILQPRDGVEAKPLAAPGAPPASPTLPKLGGNDSAIVPQRQLPDVDVTSGAAKSPTPDKMPVPVSSPLAATPSVKSAPIAAAPVPQKPVESEAKLAIKPDVAGDGEKHSFSFEKDKSDLSDDVKSKLNTMADGLKKSQGRARIVAYAAGGAEEASVARRISLSRALQIRAFLISKGVNPLSLNVQALGNQTNADTADVFVK